MTPQPPQQVNTGQVHPNPLSTSLLTLHSPINEMDGDMQNTSQGVQPFTAAHFQEVAK